MNDTVEIIIRTVNQALPGIKQAIKQLNHIFQLYFCFFDKIELFYSLFNTR